MSSPPQFKAGDGSTTSSGARLSKRLRVLLVSGYLGEGGGAERQITELALHLDRNRFDPSIVALVPRSVRHRHRGTYYGRLRDASVEVTTIERSHRLGPVQLARLALHLRERRPHIVHSFLFSENWRARLACLAAPGVRAISSERSVNAWKRYHHHALERALERITHRIVVNADAIRSFLVSEGGLAASKIVVIPNGVDAERFSPLPDRLAARSARGWAPDDFVVGHTGTMVSHKGQSQVLRACAAAAAQIPALRLVLMGDGPERPALLELANTLGLDARVEMPGFVSDVRGVLGCLDVYVHFSREREGCSNAILEAMACGLPVVATDVGGNRELVEDGVTGILVPEEDVDATARALCRLGTDRSLRERLGRAALDATRTRFSIQRMVEATSRLYETVATADGA